MIARRLQDLPRQRVACTVIRVSKVTSHSNRIAARPSELLPWADPYIAKLVRQLQSEIRRERPTGVSASHRSPVNDLEPPAPGFDNRPSPVLDWDGHNEPHWPSSERISDADD